MSGPLAAAEYTDAVGRFATGVTLVTVRDGRDDIGSTVTAFTSVSDDPPTVLISLLSAGYLAEAVDRAGLFAVSVLAAAQRPLAGRFAAEGRPSARLLLAAVPHHRGPHTGALVPDAAPAALECRVTRRIEAADHTLFLAEVDAATVQADTAPLIRHRGGYLR
ncbi:flavin reductase family protein [Allonocardiopsis opalescens]|uniref:Flavin reductase (DIM6/NTAB) family NADH-FMN oxidoreductase RutF n=1 Tax=Allonocardiopsis opalescens TaxID=1144618 RepID=A0A2T0QE00_9ACTN|nr:flavin reductase family protein [Allonocardiopsis opalescens]PRY02100.1 flavin reductase (DIM6/NTAB) family NADH-FMN oxidoreductase RutF [Allonocardiopsis opalescens]